MAVEAASTEADLVDATRLVRAYLRSLPFEVDFQADVAEELADLGTLYGPPDGVLFLGRGVDGREPDGGGAFAGGGVQPSGAPDRTAELPSWNPLRWTVRGGQAGRRPGERSWRKESTGSGR